eukprot:CAMPEP_0119289286 /NCGR_PEP_ID=MMETSP1329-20130426/38774_1 /TAXON_ID=114041 /ORGANISM="Genus nov. species nov., Strain RCC1024" /LENGTH=1488 /DNA_ID=CAMNT_0007290085 /DNA_START=1173 /DNA_END=5636 /DNA_ORIENTATION=-
MDLQQEFEDDSISVIDGTSTRCINRIDLDSVKTKVGPLEAECVRSNISGYQEAATSGPGPSMTARGMQTDTCNSREPRPSYVNEHSCDTVHKSNFVESAEANLRHRLLKSSSIAAPGSMMGSIARTVKSVADLIHLRCHLSSNAAQHLSAMVKSLSHDLSQDRRLWGTIILRLVERACRTLNLDVPAGDHMDIRPYVKLKTIPGGDPRESRYLDGILFCKSLVHKSMACACKTPRVLLLSGGIDFQRTSSRLASFGTLVEQEQKYTQIMVERLVRSRPNLLLVGKSVSRQAQEYLLEHDVIVMQNIKQNLMKRIARMTDCTILSSTDHANNMGQLGCASFGCCRTFQIVAYSSLTTLSGRIRNFNLTFGSCSEHNSCRNVLHNRRVSRQGFKSYVCLVGCQGTRGCTLILRGANALVLKKVKHIVRFSLYVAYHLRLETSYLSDSGATLPLPDNKSSSCNLLSVSLEVNFVNINSRTKSSPHLTNVPPTSAYDHQSLLVTSVWMSQHIQCASAEVKSIYFYTPQDVCLGQFLMDSCFNLDLKSCHGDRRVLDMTQIFYHNTGQLTITVMSLDQSLPTNNPPRSDVDAPASIKDWPILMWSYCRKCERVVTPLTPMSRDTWNMSFGKFLEISFYNKMAFCRTTDCRHSIQAEHVHFFGCGCFAARIEHDDIHPYGIHLRTGLPFDRQFHALKLKEQHVQLHELFHQLFQQFREKIMHLKSLLNVISNVDAPVSSIIPQCTTTSISSEICKISDELLQHSSKLEHNLEVALYDCENTLTPHRGSTNPSVLHFPGQCRRELHVRATNWNAQLSLLGRLLTSLLRASTGDTPATKADLVASEIHKLQAIKMAIQSTVRQREERELDEDDLEEGMNERFEHNATYEETNCSNEHDMENAKARAQLVTQDAIAEPGHGTSESHILRNNSFLDLVSAPKKLNLQQESLPQKHVDCCSQNEGIVWNSRGGTYKLSSALARFMGKESQEKDPWSVDLRFLLDSWPCFDRSSRGEEMLLVHAGKPTTIIAYSLSTAEYRNALQIYLGENVGTTATGPLSRALRLPKTGTGNVASATPSVSAETGSIVCANSADRLQPNAKSAASCGGPLSPPWAEGLATLISPCEDSSANRCASECSAAAKSNLGSDPYESFVKVATDDTMATRQVIRNAINIHAKYISERELLSPRKSHVKHRFADIDERGNTLCKFVCQTYWATQFAAVRQAYIGLGKGEELGYLRSLSMAQPWNAQGGKSGATFLKTDDGRFVVKQITRTELQMFLEYAPAYFEYLSKSFFHKYSTLLVKVLGVYQIGSHNRVNGKRIMEQVVVMENLFHECSITCAFDLKGSTRSRYARVRTTESAKLTSQEPEEPATFAPRRAHPVLLDENFVEFTNGRPLPMHDQAKAYFNSAVLNDTLFLSLINVVDYSILVGLDEEHHELVVGIIDYMRQYDILKKMERMGKSVGMIAGQAEPTVIQPPNYRNRFQAAMERYFMMVPNKW